MLSRYAQAQDRVDRLLYRAAETLAEAMASVDGSDIPDEVESDDDIDEDTGAPRVWFGVDPPQDTWLSDLRDGGVYIMVTGAEYREEGEIGTPSVYAGVGWNAGRAGKKRIAGPK